MAREKITAPSVEKIRGGIDKGRGGKDIGFRFDEFGYFRKSPKTPCAWAEKDKPFPLGRTELDIITDENAAKLGVPAGPALRLCIEKNKPAPIVPVSDPFKAQDIAGMFRDCVVGGGNQMECAVKTLAEKRPGEEMKIAGVRGGRRGLRAPKRTAPRKSRKSSRR